jgi:hypothetical protein
MGFATTVVTEELADTLWGREDFILIDTTVWDDDGKVFLEFIHPDAPDGRHVDVILDEEGLRFKPDADV